MMNPPQIVPQERVKLDLYQGQILPWQKLARNSKVRFLVFVAGRKARKTTFIVNRLVYKAASDKRGLTYAYIAPFRKQAKEIVWDDHLGRLLRIFTLHGISYTTNKSDLTIYFPDSGGKFQVTGADSAEALRGKSDWGGVGCDEYASWKPYVWQEIIRPNLTVHNAWAIIGGTPKGYGNDFYKMAKLGDHSHIIDDKPVITDVDYMTFHATSYDNIHLPPGEIDSAKRTTTIDFFNQEHLALFTRFTGLVYPEFEISTHVEWFDHEKNSHADYLFSMDFAVRGFTAALIGKIDTQGEIWILDEYKVQNDITGNHGAKIKEKILLYSDLEKQTGYGDPAGWINSQQANELTQKQFNGAMTWSLADEYIEDGLPLIPANNEVTAGINYVRQLFKNKKIHIHARCEKLIDELMQYQWKEQPQTQIGEMDEPEKVRKINDHLVDCLRYLCFSKPSPAEEQKIVAPGMPIIFGPPRIEKPSEDKLEEIEVSSLYDEA
jgi:hypothetical protein